MTHGVDIDNVYHKSVPTWLNNKISKTETRKCTISNCQNKENNCSLNTKQCHKQRQYKKTNKTAARKSKNLNWNEGWVDSGRDKLLVRFDE